MVESARSLEQLNSVISKLKSFEQRNVVVHIIRHLDGLLNSSPVRRSDKTKLSTLAATGSVLRAMSSVNENVKELLIDMMARPDGPLGAMSPALLRASIAALSNDRVSIDRLLEKAFASFCNDIFIKHAPIIQQEIITQLLLLVSGISHRFNPHRLSTLSKSSSYLNSISKHFSSNSLRVRWLGMVVGQSISQLVDKQETKMKFTDESLDTDETRWYTSLLHLEELPLAKPDLPSLFRPKTQMEKEVVPPTALQIRPKQPVRKKAQQEPKASTSTRRIVEIVDDDDLVPYAKPDSDPEDDDPDPTLVNREKPKPPVYIRDLLVGLRETENYDKFLVALNTAATLIRQKSGYGNEVRDHAEELASTLMNLDDRFEIKNFMELRQEALVALLLADPSNIGQYLSRNAFDGDFSIQQRSSILAALGLGSRELAGFQDQDRSEVPNFPSKKLPEHLHNVYADDNTSSLLRVSARVQQEVVEPLAVQAAEDMAGPNALKVRTFSSRIEKSKTKRKPVANALAKIVADSIFFPLTGRWWGQMKSYGHQSHFVSVHLLPIYVRTLAIILHAAGPFNLSLPQMTSEFWAVLLALRGSSLNDKQYMVLEAVLFGFLILLEVNDDKERLARDHAKELLETQEWVRLVLGQVSAGGEEGDKVRALAASVVVRCQEVVERWQRSMVGDLINY